MSEDPYYELRKLIEEGYTIRITPPVFHIEVLAGDEVVAVGETGYFPDAMLEAWMATPDHKAIVNSEDQPLRAAGAEPLPVLE